MRKWERGVARGCVAATALGACLAVAVGCDGQADPSYEGEPLVSVSGRVEAELAVGDDVAVGVLWLTTAGDFGLACTAEVEVESEPSACVDACGEFSCETAVAWEACTSGCTDITYIWIEITTPTNPFITGGVGQTTPVTGQFPAQFSLDILAPPPAEALIGSTTGERLAIGLLVALDPAGAPWQLDLSRVAQYPEWLLGGSEEHFLVYAPEAVPESSIWSLAFGVTLAPGYSLMELVDESTPDGDQEGVREVLDADASNVRLRIAPPDSITWPWIGN